MNRIVEFAASFLLNAAWQISAVAIAALLDNFSAKRGGTLHHVLGSGALGLSVAFRFGVFLIE